MQRVCVFCGSKAGGDGRYRAAAEQFGRDLARRKLTLVYGGGSVGLMGVVADATLANAGAVVGVIPKVLATKELLHPGVADMRIVDGMHARKALMAELADAFVALPGGFGTFEEIFEMITWAQLGLQCKPIGFLNTAGYFTHLIAFIDHAVAEGFIKPKHRALFVVADNPVDLLDALARHHAPRIEPVLRPDEV